MHKKYEKIKYFWMIIVLNCSKFTILKKQRVKLKKKYFALSKYVNETQS